MSEWDDLLLVAPVFLVMGIACIAAYIAPAIICKLDEWREAELERAKEKVEN